MDAVKTAVLQALVEDKLVGFGAIRTPAEQEPGLRPLSISKVGATKSGVSKPG